MSQPWPATPKQIADGTSLATRDAPCRTATHETGRLKAPLDLNRLPEQVCEIMRGYYRTYPPTVLVPHAFLPTELQIPNADRRLVRATDTLTRATGPTVVRSRCSWSRKVCSQMRTLHFLVPDREPQFYYYVGGSFVLSELLELGDWTHIDVWTQPFPVRGASDAFRIAAGKGAYPVKAMAVNNMESFIEASDHHISSCAILCCMLPGGTRGYELYMTLNCAIAYRSGVHPSRRLPSFLDGENNERPAAECTPARSDATSLFLVTQIHGAHCTSTRAQWWLEIRNGRMCSISFCFAGIAALHCAVPASMPVVCYPCCFTPAGTPGRLPEGSHWLVDLVMKGRPVSLLATRGGQRINTTSVLPDWLVDRMHLTRPQMERELQQTFLIELRGGDTGIVYFPCRLPVRLLRWQRLGSTCTGGTSFSTSETARILRKETWCFLLDAPWQRSLRSVMICRETGEVTERCDHEMRGDYALHASVF